MTRSSKTLLLLSLITPVLARASYHQDGVTSHTYFSTRPWYQTDQPVYMSSTNYLGTVKKNARGGLLQMIAFGGESTNHHALGRFFCPFDKSTLVVRSLPDLKGNAYDIVGANFNLQTNPLNAFQSTISFKPKQRAFGFALAFKQNFGKKWWIETTAPLMYVSTNMKLEEDVTNPAAVLGGAGFEGSLNAVNTMTEAFRAPDMLYGRIDGPQNASGLGELEVRAGYKTITRNDFYWHSYVGVIVSGSNVPKAKYMFEPITGNGGHAGVDTGTNFGFEWHKKPTYSFWVEGNLHGIWLFSNTQKRSFDLFNKQWGRYLALCNIQNPSIPLYGVNILTQDVKVHPRSSRSLTLTLVFTHAMGWQAEAGYQFYGRQAEHIELANTWYGQYGLYDFYGSGFTSSGRTIDSNDNQNNDGTLIAIQEKDLNINSATHPAYVTYTVYGAVSKTVEFTRCPLMMAAGSSYEFGSGNESMDRFTLWVKAACAF